MFKKRRCLYEGRGLYKEHVILKKLIYKNGVLRKEEQDEE